MYTHLKPANRVAAPVSRLVETLRPYRNFPAVREGRIRGLVHEGTNTLMKKFKFVEGPEKQTSNELKFRVERDDLGKPLRDKDGKFIEQIYTYSIFSSTMKPNTYIVQFKKSGAKVPHKVTFVKKDDGWEYYNSTGNPIYNLPEELVYDVTKDILNPEAPTYKHQTDDPICGRHSLVRACFSHLTNEEYDAMLKDAQAQHDLESPADVIWRATEASVAAPSLEQRPKPQTSLATLEGQGKKSKYKQMPYKLRKAPKRELYWVVTSETGKKHSKEPIPLEKAKAQLRILKSALRGGADEDEEMNYLGGLPELNLGNYVENPDRSPNPLPENLGLPNPAGGPNLGPRGEPRTFVINANRLPVAAPPRRVAPRQGPVQFMEPVAAAPARRRRRKGEKWPRSEFEPVQLSRGSVGGGKCKVCGGMKPRR